MLYYVPTTMLLAPFVVADSDGIWKPEQLDVRFWKLKGVLHYELSTRHLSFVVVLVSKWYLKSQTVYYYKSGRFVSMFSILGSLLGAVHAVRAPL